MQILLCSIYRGFWKKQWWCSIQKLLESNELNLPPARNLPGDDGPHSPCFCCRWGICIMKIMKPYSQRAFDNPNKIFNYCLSRAWKSVECAFGITCSKFKIFHKPIACNVDKADSIVKATCSSQLHKSMMEYLQLLRAH